MRLLLWGGRSGLNTTLEVSGKSTGYKEGIKLWRLTFHWIPELKCKCRESFSKRTFDLPNSCKLLSYALAIYTLINFLWPKMVFFLPHLGIQIMAIFNNENYILKKSNFLQWYSDFGNPQSISILIFSFLEKGKKKSSYPSSSYPLKVWGWSFYYPKIASSFWRRRWYYMTILLYLYFCIFI